MTMKIAIAGSSGLAQIIARYLQDTVHTTLILSRYAQPSLEQQGYQTAVVDYDDQNLLRFMLRGVDVVISTVSGNPQINLIDAAAHSGVQRFVPAEFEGPINHRPANNDPLDRGKRAVLARLRDWSHHSRHRMAFTIFSCGVFYERFAPGGLATYDIGSSTGIQRQGSYLMDVAAGTAEICERTSNGQPIYISMTSVYDLARYIVAALDLGLDRWQPEFRLRGDRRTVTEIVQWGAVVKNIQSLSITVIEPGDLRAHLEHATYYQEWAKVARVQELMATEQRRYDFTQPNLNQLVNVVPMTFWNWLSGQYPLPAS